MNSLGKTLGTALSLLFGCLIVVQSAVVAKDKQVIPAAVAQADLDQAIAWMTEAKRNYTAVKDYTCMLVSQEKVNGKLLDQNFIQLKMRTQPFSVRMRWLGPEKSKGQEVIFVEGANNNKMLAKSNIFGGGWWTKDVNDPLVTKHSRHNIREAGIGNMIEQTLVQWQKDRKNGGTSVKIAAFLCNGKECHKIELTRLVRDPGCYCHRTEIYLEKGSKLPIRLDNYDWPTERGPAGGEKLESFNYVNLEFNVGLTGADFTK